MPRFVPRQRKHKVRAREQNGPSATAQSNQEIIIPASKADREAKRQKLKEELRAQQPNISSKKQKRLDKYIENKLRKDETQELLRKLEEEKEKFDASAAVQSAKGLGKRNFDDFVRGSGVGDRKEDKRHNASRTQDLSDEESEDSFEEENRDRFTSRKDSEESEKPVTSLAVQGSGLAQPLALDENGLPIIQTRKSKKKKMSESLPPELPWEGFDSEADESSNDSEDSMSEIPSDDSEAGDLDSDSNISGSEEEEEGSEEESENSGSETSNNEKPKTRKSAFKAWATQQVNHSIGHVPSYANGEGVLLPKPMPSASKAQAEDRKPKATEARMNSVPNRLAYAVHVDRPDDIQLARSQLPILQREQEIMEAVHNNPVVIIKGDTGSGKTTQLPQFLFEAGYGSPGGPTPGLIGITQPRRVAAVSMAKRVGVELGQFGDKVSYQIRFDSTVSPNTAVKFMTDGILLRELSEDLLLRKYSVIVVDEAHERSVNTDILIGMLSKIVPARMQKNQFNPCPTPLKLIIMSATLNIEDFLHEKLFAASWRPPIVEAEGRQHRVTTHFALKSRGDYVEEVVEKVRRAHRKLPRGGILVFLTGQNEIRQVAHRLRVLLDRRSESDSRMNLQRAEIAASEAPLEAEDLDLGDFKNIEQQDDFDLDILTPSEDEAEGKEFDISDDEEQDEETPGKSNAMSSKEPYTSVHILPLYSQLPTAEQLKVFEPPPLGSRLIVLATNVAETSLTIPGIRYVFDTGRSKERKYNLNTGVQSFEIDYICKASAQQRTGRAGRTGPGHCWRLYTSAVYEQFFPDHAEPEILRAPAESVVLQLKGFEYPRPIADFPFPTPPAAATLYKAERLLKNLGALTSSGSITNLGRQLSIYPLSPRLGKILVAGVNDPTLLWQIIRVVSGLAVPEIFITEAQLDLNNSTDTRQENAVYTLENQQEDDKRDKLRQEYGRARATLSKTDKTSDAMKLFTAVSMYLDAPAASREEICQTLFLRSKAMSEISQLQSQLEHLIRANHRSISSDTLAASRGSSKLSASKVRLLNTLVASGYVDQVAIRYDRAPQIPDVPNKPRRAIDVPYLPLLSLHEHASASLTEKAVFIHPSSVLSRLNIKELPEYIIYSNLQRSQTRTITSSISSLTNTGAPAPKTRMFPLTPIDGVQLALLARDTALIEYGKPVPRSAIEDIPGTPKRRECWVLVTLKGQDGTGGMAWPLPPVKVRQVLDAKSKTGWRVEKVLS